MLATLVDTPFDRTGWFFEPKWDGYRAIADVSRKGVRLWSRNQNALEGKYPAVAQALETFKHDAILDGEIVVLDARGKSHFELLQNYRRAGQGQLVYYVFDLLYLDGHDLRGLPLRRRKEALATLLGKEGTVRLSDHIEDAGVRFFEAAAAHGLEGIVAKDAESRYVEGERSRSWLKIKSRQQQEAVIAGFTEPRGGRKHLGSLILGVYDGDNLVYIGHTGGGFAGKALAEVRAKLEPLVRETAPFAVPPRPNAPVHWVEPKLVCEVAFQEWTDSGVIRQPIFLGFREDKSPREVRREFSVSPRAALKPKESASLKAKAHKRATAAAREPSPSAAEHEVALSHQDKVFWPDEGYTKGDLFAYYRDLAPVMLRYLKDRPESLRRQPDGIRGKNFFQKDVGRTRPPDWVETASIPSRSEKRNIEYLVCQNEETLLYLVNLGCIEINPWNSRIHSLERPDYLVIDLDPGEIPFDRVIEAAQAVRKLLDGAGAESVCKTSGMTGLHIYVPLGARYSYDEAATFAEIVANLTVQALPELTSVVRSPARRRRQVYVDFLQNARGQTLAAPYSVRPAPGATVSTPLKWTEVKRGLDPTRFTIRTLGKRVARLGDLWAPVLGPGVDLAACLKRLAGQTRPIRLHM